LLPFVLEEVFERNGCREPYYQCAGVVIKKMTGGSEDRYGEEDIG
jgi:hypothetical protein